MPRHLGKHVLTAVFLTSRQLCCKPQGSDKSLADCQYLLGIFSFTDHVVFQAENRVRPVERSASTRLRAHNVVRTFLAGERASAHPVCAGNFTTCVVSCPLQTFSNLVGNVTTTFAGIASSMLKRTRCPDKRGGPLWAELLD